MIASKTSLIRIGAKNKLRNKPIQVTKPANKASISSLTVIFIYPATLVMVRVISKALFSTPFSKSRLNYNMSEVI
ncbi:MAG: hypothetical protein ACFCAD_12000 [Pleurocapsa sp.]